MKLAQSNGKMLTFATLCWSKKNNNTESSFVYEYVLHENLHDSSNFKWTLDWQMDLVAEIQYHI